MRIASGGLAAAVERGEAARRQWTKDGSLLPQAVFAARRGWPLPELEALEARGELFSVGVDCARWYPAALLRLSPHDSAALCEALAGLEPAAKLVFIMRAHGALGGKTATAAIAQGGINSVLDLASAWRAEAGA